MTDGNPAAIDLLKKASLSAGFFMLRMAGARRPGLKSPFYQRRFKLCDAGIERGPGQARFMRIKPDPALPKMMPALSQRPASFTKNASRASSARPGARLVGPHQIGALRRDQTDGVSAGVSRRAVFTRASTARQMLFGFCLLS